MSKNPITFEQTRSGDIKDDVWMTGLYLRQQFARRFSDEKDSNEVFASVLKAFLVSAHRAEPGCTKKLTNDILDAAEWVKRDRELIIRKKLGGWENYR